MVEHPSPGQSLKAFISRCNGMNAKPNHVRNVIYIQPIGTIPIAKKGGAASGKKNSMDHTAQNTQLLEHDGVFMGYLKTFLE